MLVGWEFELTSYAQMVAAVPTVTVGGFSVSAAARQPAATMMIRAASERAGAGRPLYFTSINGEVIARARVEPDIETLFSAADQILADGQPLVLAS
ncbi:MAG: hypothetical protein ACTHOP_00705, partial [Mesorhizobium sp.]